MSKQLNVRGRLDAKSWLLTGGTGFLGSVLIEQLLRTCNPKKIVLIVLPKSGVPVMDQVAKLLSRPLYNTVRKAYGSTAEMLKLFEVIEADLSDPDPLPMPAVDIVVHCAASISFNNHIHEAISANFKATNMMANAAAGMAGLQAFVHISTCYVNGNQPRGSRVAEAPVGPLMLDGRPVDYRALVKELMELPHEEAEERAKEYRTIWNFPNNYAMTKRLAEYVLMDAHKSGLPVRVVRPSIVGGTSLRHICPGYIGNAAGSTAFALGIAFGMWTCTEWTPSNSSDLSPADHVCNCIILAAAAEREKGEAVPLILQSATTGVDPLTNEFFYNVVTRYEHDNPAPFKVFHGYPKLHMSDIVCKTNKEYKSALRRCNASIKARSLGLRLAGHGGAANTMSTRWKVFKVVSCKSMDFNLYFESSNAAAMYASLSPEEQALFPCVWLKDKDQWVPYLDTYMKAVWDRYVTPASRRPAKKAKKAHSGKASMLCCGPASVSVKE